MVCISLQINTETIRKCSGMLCEIIKITMVGHIAPLKATVRQVIELKKSELAAMAAITPLSEKYLNVYFHFETSIMNSLKHNVTWY